MPSTAASRKPAAARTRSAVRESPTPPSMTVSSRVPSWPPATIESATSAIHPAIASSRCRALHRPSRRHSPSHPTASTSRPAPAARSRQDARTRSRQAGMRLTADAGWGYPPYRGPDSHARAHGPARPATLMRRRCGEAHVRWRRSPHERRGASHPRKTRPTAPQEPAAEPSVRMNGEAGSRSLGRRSRKGTGFLDLRLHRRLPLVSVQHPESWCPPRRL